MESTTGSAGVAVLALFVLWFAYYVPHRVKQRQQFLDSRVEDRFSGSLRVLGVSSGRRDRRQPVHATSDEGRSLLLGPAVVTASEVGLVLRTSDAGGGSPREVQQVAAGGTTARRPSSKEGPQAMETDVRSGDPRPSIPPGRRAQGGLDDPFPTRRAVASSRIAVLERRAKAARRRLALTALLLVASVGAWVAVGSSLVAWYAAAGPTAALVLVLVLGRQAVLAARRADTVWLTERRTAARNAARASRGPVQGSPVAPRNAQAARVTGHAVRSSQTNTQMIPRVTPADLERGAARSRDRRPSTGSTSRVAPSTEPELPASRSGASGGALFDDRERGAQAVPPAQGEAVATASGEQPVVPADRTAGESAGGESARPDAGPRGRDARPAPAVVGEPGGVWEPVPVPRPTYTMKPTASETGVPPVRVAVPVASAATPRPHQGATTGGEGAPSGRPALPAAGDDKKPSTETLGLDLNEILARRRVSGA